MKTLSLFLRKVLLIITFGLIAQLVFSQAFTPEELIKKSIDKLQWNRVVPTKVFNNIQKNMETTYYYLDSLYVIDNEGSIQFYTDFTYDNQNRLTEGVLGVMGYRMKWEYEYDEQNRLSKEAFYFDEQVGIYTPVDYTDYYYGDNGLLDHEITFSFDGANWLESFHHFYTYNENDLLTYKWGEVDADGTFITYMTLNLFYDNQDRLILDSLRHIPQLGTELQDSLKHTYSYDANSNLIEKTAYYWAENQNIWKEYDKEVNEWDASNRLLSKTIYIANSSGAFIESEKDENNWSSTGVLEGITISLWNIGQQQWVNFEKYEHDYDLSVTSDYVIYPDCPPGAGEYYAKYTHKLNEINGYKWQGGQWTTNPFYNQKLYYLEVTPAGEIEIEKDPIIKVFPNPADDYVKVSGDEISEFILFDITGKKVNSVKNDRMEIGDLKPGVYFYEIHTIKKVVRRDVLIIK